MKFFKTRKLKEAVFQGNWSKARDLIAKGAVPTAGMLNIAVYASYPSAEGIKLLIDAGAKPEAAALYRAVECREKQITGLLTAAGAVPDARTLMYAVEHLDAQWVKKLLDAGAQPTQEALFASITSHRISANKTVSQVLIDAGVVPDARSREAARYWWGQELGRAFVKSAPKIAPQKISPQTALRRARARLAAGL